MRRNIKKISKYLIRTILVLVFLLLLGITAFYVYINSNAGKRQLASELGKYLGKTLGTEVVIGNAAWHFPSSVSLGHVVINDHRHNKMFVIEKLEAGLAYYDFITKRITFSEVELKDVKFDLTRYIGDSSSNFGFVINRLSAGGDATKRSTTDIMFNVVNIENLHFTWNDQTKGRISYPGIDWDHIDVAKFNGLFTYLWIDGNDVSAKIKKLNLTEGSGFVINDMQGIAKYTSKNIEIKSLDLVTPFSEIGRYVRIDYKDNESLSDFVNQVDMRANFSNSKVSFKDLRYFTPDLKNKTDSVIFANLEANGRVNDLHIQDIDASFGNNSELKGKLEMKGLPNINETFIAAKFKQSHTSRKEMEHLMPEIMLPEILDKLGNFKMKGNFTGFINDFVALADFETALGKASTDLHMKIVKNPALCTYSGKLALDGFNIGKLTDEPLLGFTSMNGEIKGTGLSLETIQANLLADVKQMDFKGYSYHDITINGNVSRKFFNGAVLVKDKHLTLDFKGTVDYSKEKPEFNFLANIPNANLFALNLANDSLILSSTVRINLRGIKPDDIDGQIIAKDTRLFIPGAAYHFDSINVNSTIGLHHRDINIYSDLLKANINGDFQVSRLGDLLKSAANRYIDSGFMHIKVEPLKDQYVNFDIDFLDMTPVFSVFRTKASLSDSGYLKGSIYADDNKVELEGSVPGLTYKDLHFKNLKLKGTGNHNNLNLAIDVGSFFDRDTMLVRDAKIKLRSNIDKLFFDIYGADQLRQKQAWLKGSLDVEGKLAFLDLDSSKMQVYSDAWNITSKRITFYKDTLMDVPMINLNRGNQSIRIAGQYSRTTSYPIRAILENLNLTTIATFIPQMTGLTGDINGQVLVNNINAKPIVEAAVYISTLAYQNDTIGTFSVSTSYDENTRKLSLDTKLETKDQEEVATAKGDIKIDQKEELALNVNLNRTDIKVFEPLISDFFSELKGHATADLAITGDLNEPVVNGGIQLIGAEFKVNYTNVKYHFDHNFTLGGRIINIKNLEVHDKNENIAKVNGKFDLSHLDDVRMNLAINAKNFQALNTTQKLNDLYFGKAFGTGLVSIDGPLDNLKFNIKMRTDKGTTFSMPISQGNTFYGHEYIRFVAKGNPIKKALTSTRMSGIELSMDLEITPDAFAQIIFDPRVGDIIEAHGKGNLKLDVNSDGDFSMFGTYSITDGKYLFTAFDVINKSFGINPGSTITWNGNPYDAQLNVDATYTVRTSLTALQTQVGSNTTATSTTNTVDTKIYPVDTKLNLKGSLFQPEIKLDFEIKELYEGSPSTTDIETHVRQIKSNEQDLNQQVVSLLVLNQFMPAEQGGGGLNNLNVNNTVNNTFNSSLGDFASNQLNYLLSQYVEGVNIGVDYRLNEEATLRVSQDIFKQRANISASYDAINNNYNTQLSYKLRSDGSIQAKVFGRSNNNPVYSQNSNTQGLGYLHRIEFDTFDELFRKKAVKPKPK